MKYLGISLATTFALVLFAGEGHAKMHERHGGLQAQDELKEVIHGKAVLPGQLAHRYDEKMFPPVGDIPMMMTPDKVMKGDHEKIGIR